MYLPVAASFLYDFSGMHKIVWCYATHIVDIKKCPMKYFPETDFEYAFVTMINKLIFGHETILKPLFIILRGMNSDDTLVTYTVDFLTKKRVKNNGIVPQYYVENSHEVIIPREVFMQVQEELVRRHIVHTSPIGKTRTFSSNHCFAQIVICSNCDEVFRWVHRNNRGKKSIVWLCVSRLENTGLFCDAPYKLQRSVSCLIQVSPDVHFFLRLTISPTTNDIIIDAAISNSQPRNAAS